MKAAILNTQGIVENVIMWDETCSLGMRHILVEDHASVGVGYTYNPDGSFTAPAQEKIDYPYNVLRAVEYPPMADYLDGIVKGDQAQIDKYIADCQAVKAKYPKPEIE